MDILKKNKKLVIPGIVLLVIVIAIILFLLPNKKVVCTMKTNQSQSGYTLEAKYVIRARSGYVKTVNITEIITAKEKEKRKSFEQNFNNQYSFNKENYGGYTYTVTNENGKVTSNVTIDYRVFDMKKFIESNAAMERFTENNRLTLEGAIEMYKSTGATCK